MQVFKIDCEKRPGICSVYCAFDRLICEGLCNDCVQFPPGSWDVPDLVCPSNPDFVCEEPGKHYAKFGYYDEDVSYTEPPGPTDNCETKPIKLAIKGHKAKMKIQIWKSKCIGNSVSGSEIFKIDCETTPGECRVECNGQLACKGSCEAGCLNYGEDEDLKFTCGEDKQPFNCEIPTTTTEGVTEATNSSESTTTQTSQPFTNPDGTPIRDADEDSIREVVKRNMFKNLTADSFTVSRI